MDEKPRATAKVARKNAKRPVMINKKPAVIAKTAHREAVAKAWEEAAEITKQFLGGFLDKIEAPIVVGLVEIFREKAKEARRRG